MPPRLGAVGSLFGRPDPEPVVTTGKPDQCLERLVRGEREAKPTTGGLDDTVSFESLRHESDFSARPGLGSVIDDSDTTERDRVARYPELGRDRKLELPRVRSRKRLGDEGR